jgi:hypothetical protein
MTMTLIASAITMIAWPAAPRGGLVWVTGSPS